MGKSRRGSPEAQISGCSFPPQSIHGEQQTGEVILHKVHHRSVGSPVISEKNSVDEEMERDIFSFPTRKKMVEGDEDEEKEIRQRRECDEDGIPQKEG